MTLQVDSSILHEIVRVIESRQKVPERIRLAGYEYQLTYLEDHKQRLEDALRRRDSDRLNMLYGQLASKVKYQALRELPRQRGADQKPQRQRSPATASGREKKVAGARRQVSAAAKKSVAKKGSLSGKAGGRKKARISRAARS